MTAEAPPSTRRDELLADIGDAGDPTGDSPSLAAIHADARSVNASDTITVLGTTDDSRATKLHRRTGDGWHTDSYDRVCYCRPQTREVSSIFDLWDLLSSLEDCSDWLIVRGELTGKEACQVDDETPIIRRNKNPKDPKYRCEHDDGECPPHLTEADPGRRWMMLDIDDLAVDDLPGAKPVDDPSPRELDILRYAVIEQLPAWLHDATHVYQWSASAGLDDWDELSLHLWFWLDRPVYDPSLRNYWQSYREETGVPVDWHLFNAVQPHYVGAPIFDGGTDPLGDARSGLAELEKRSVWPPSQILDAEAWQEREQKRKQQREQKRQEARKRRRYSSDARAETRVESYVQGALESACETIETAPKGTRHGTIYSEAKGIGGILKSPDLPPAALDEPTARSALVQAGRNVLPPKRHDEVARTVDDAFEAAEPRDLSEVEAPTHKGKTNGGRERASETTRDASSDDCSRTDSSTTSTAATEESSAEEIEVPSIDDMLEQHDSDSSSPVA